MTLLQVQSFGVFETLTQYGALGVVTLALGYVVWSLLKRQIASEDRLKSKVEELQKEMNDYIKTDLQKVTTALENNTKAMNDLRDIIIRKNS
jgi:uncharacterized membrane-anchored protein YhcB (DUF1043 family)